MHKLRKQTSGRGAGEAIKWFKKAAEQGYSESQGSMDECYRKENGPSDFNDDVEMWLTDTLGHRAVESHYQN